MGRGYKPSGIAVAWRGSVGAGQKSNQLKTRGASRAFIVARLYLYRYIAGMTSSLSQLQERREQILRDMAGIDHLRRGSFSRQFFGSRDSAPEGRQGPYFILQGYLQGQKFSERIPAAQAPQVETLVANYKHFQQLAENFITVTDQITRLSASTEDLKKKRTCPSRSIRSGSGKPMPSSG